MSGRAKFELFRDRQKRWRWRLLATNGKIIATSGEGYTRRGAALRGIDLVCGFAAEPIRIVNEEAER